MMAATWGEITGSPGVSVSTRGPGAANMVNGVAHAWMDRAPLIVINDQYPGATYETGMRQVLNQHALFAPITKWQSTIHAKSVRQQIRRAIRVTTTPTPGPVQFDMPSNETMGEAVVAAGEEGARARCELTHLLSMDISWTGTLVRSPWLAFAIWSLALN